MKSNRRIVNHGTGKGDKSRVTDSAAYARNIEQIKFSGVTARHDGDFFPKGNKQVKRYGERGDHAAFDFVAGGVIIH